MKATGAFFAMVLGLAIPFTTGFAADWGFLKDAPAEVFTKEDWDIFNSTYKKFLDEGKDGETTKWSNPATTAKGELTLLKTSEEKGVTCRSLKVANEAKKRKATNTFRLCKQPDGEWKIPASAPKKSGPKPAAAQ